MSIRSYEINLDSFSSLIPEPIVGRQGDKNGAVTLYVTVTDRGSAVDLTEQTINLMAKTAKGTAIIADNAGVTITDAVNGKFTYEIPNALWSEAGKIKDAYFSLNDTDGQQTTYDLIFIVKKAIDISQDKAEDYITIIDGTLRDLQEKIDAIYDAYQTGAFYSRNEIDEFNANFETRISSNETYIEDVKDNSSDAYITSLKIPLRCGWQDLSSGWYPQGFSVNKDKNELYLSTEITGGTETRIEIHDLSTGDLKSMKSFTNEANSFSEGIPYFYNTDGDLCFIVSIVNGNGYAIFNYDAGTIGSNIIINGKFKWGVEGNNFVTTDAFETNITKYSVYDWESIKSGSPTLQQDVYTETTGTLFAKAQGLTMSNGNVYLAMGAYGTTIGLQSYSQNGRIVKQVEFNKQSMAEFINSQYPGAISETSDYLLEAEGAYTLGHTLLIGAVIEGYFYLVTSGLPDGYKVQTNIPVNDNKSDFQLLPVGSDILMLPSGKYEGFSFVNGPLGPEDTSIIQVTVEISNNGRKIISVTQSSTGNQWTKTVHTDGKGGSEDWLVKTGSAFVNTDVNPKNGITATNISYFKETQGSFAKKIELRIDKATNIPVNAYTIIASIPSDIAPTHQVALVIPAYNAMSNHDKYASLWVTTGGDVYIATSTSATKSDIYSAVIDWVKW
ncbi:DUF2479 domain-containing protein [Lactiplantibacillus plantarum]|uniref:phage baseplate upper protein n=1 Tax=Lactiplantibacillus plantarum TaxID=1590 RepID=UPI0021A27558|nr:phage baseplate upper protein [Lactiplantibacillus plantarum]MCT3215838.1 DUF2479 domain-containing protein [Lactiplantibacillus plantarum]MCT3271069.1 DUF2479 domain-containing protein [Lactiplantibacillus plantarum]